MVNNPFNTDNKETTHKVVSKSYPESRDHRIREVFIPNEGWKMVFGVNLFQLTPENIRRVQAMGGTHINVYLVDQYDQEKFADFSLKELQKSK